MTVPQWILDARVAKRERKKQELKAAEIKKAKTKEDRATRKAKLRSRQGAARRSKGHGRQ